MTGLTRPERLRPGSKVALVAPAGPVDPAMLKRNLAALAGWGLKVEVGDHVLGRHPRLDYLAGTDEDRAADLQRAWCDPTVDAVLCARGGYGCTRMIDLLDWEAMAAAGPKVFAGFSDVTALHAAFAHRLRLATLHAPMVGSTLFDGVASEHLRATLFEPETVVRLTSPDITTVTPGIADGILCGGNLALLAAGLAAPTAPPPPKGGLVVLEDVEEEPYRIDRMLTQLLRAGWFAGVTGMVLGTWVGCGEPDEVYATVTDRLAGLDIPTVWNLRFGHCTEQITIPLGVPATLDAGRGTLTLAQPALA